MGEKSMSQLDDFKDFVALHGFTMTLGDFLRSHHAAEYRKQCTLLRHEGWTVEVDIDRSRPGANVYRFFPPAHVTVCQDGQRAFA